MCDQNVEPGFLRQSPLIELAPFKILLTDYHMHFIGRALAQLHTSGGIMRDISPDNVLFRKKDGYPVLIDDYPGYEGEFTAAKVFGDLFVPFLTMDEKRFASFTAGYFEGLQLLLPTENWNEINELKVRTGGQFVGSLDLDHGSELTLIVESFTLGKELPRSSGNNLTEEQLVWIGTIMQFYCPPRQRLEKYLEFVAKNSNYERLFLVADESLINFSSCEEHPLLKTLTERYQSQLDKIQAKTEEFSFNVPLGATAFKEVHSEQPGHTKLKELGVFWIKVLEVMSRSFEGVDASRAVYSLQAAHVILQNLCLEKEEFYYSLHRLRCSARSRDWYWSNDVENVNHLNTLMYRNSELITFTNFSELLFDAYSTEKEVGCLHLIFELIEMRRNFVGFCAGLIVERRLQGEDLIKLVSSMMIGGVMQHLDVCRNIIHTLADREDVCFTYGWCIPTPNYFANEDGDIRTPPPDGYRDVQLCVEFLKQISSKENDLPIEDIEIVHFISQLWGRSWSTPFDNLGAQGFKQLIVKTGDEPDTRDIVERAGCLMVVFERGFNEDGRQFAKMERLWPFPRERRPGHKGSYARR